MRADPDARFAALQGRLKLPGQDRLWMTAIGESPQQAQELHGQAVALLDNLAP